MAQESKAELMVRLRREGRWEPFMRRREPLKAEGIPACDAWAQAASEFPPLAPSLPVMARPVATRRELRSLKRKPPIGMLKAAQWTAENMDCEWIRPRDAPSIEAWSLLAWARQSIATRSEFYRIFGKSLAVVQESKEQMRHPSLEEVIAQAQAARQAEQVGPSG